MKNQNNIARVRFLSAGTLPELYYLRQFPGRTPIWDGLKYSINNDEIDTDSLVVYEDVIKPIRVRFQPGRSVLFTAEPPPVKKYNPDFLAQFDYVICVDRKIKHRAPVFSQQALGWMLGWKFFNDDGKDIKDYDFFKNPVYPEKQDSFSMIISSKQITPGHRMRYDFALRLKEHFKDKMQLYGVGIQKIDDKWEGLAPHKYTIAMENFSCKDYWTEKLADAYLAGCFPLYYGCSNIDTYFSPKSLGLINPRDVSGTVALMEKILEEDIWSQSALELERARIKVLDEHNVFSLATRVLQGGKNRGESGTLKSNVERIIQPHGYFVNKTWRGKVRSLLSSMRERLAS